MKLSVCCYKALKHGEKICPVCNTNIFKVIGIQREGVQHERRN
jgi:hypothetical protein